MKIRQICLHLLMLTVMFCLPAKVHAAKVANFWDVVIPVENQGAASFQKAAKRGLERVLIRASGEQNVLDNSEISQAMANAERYVSQYAYGGEFDRPTVTLSYASAPVVALLRKAELPVWSDDRPMLVSWLVVDGPEGKQFVTEEAFPELAKALSAEASRRGLALTLPLYDLRDTTAISPDSLWNLDSFAVQQASQRYNTQSILIGRLSPLSGGVWVSEWAYMQEGQTRRMDARDAAFRFLRPAMNMVADTMASAYAVAPVQQSLDLAMGTVMHVSGVSGFSDYAEVVRHLEASPAVAHANVVWMSDSDLLINLVLRGNPEKVLGYLRLGRQLVEAGETAGSFLPPEHLAVDWFYRWAGRSGL